jgi:hypothetical protein
MQGRRGFGRWQRQDFEAEVTEERDTLRSRAEMLRDELRAIEAKLGELDKDEPSPR